MHKIIIYRHQLFQPSEGFIWQQTRYLKSYKPVFVGQTINTKYAPSNIDCFCMSSYGLKKMAAHKLMRNCEPLYQTLTIEKPELIHAHFGIEGVYALPLAKKLNIPLITTFHGFDATCHRTALLLSKKLSWINYLMHRKKLANEGDLFICVSNFIKNHVIKLGFPEEKLLTHYIGVDTESIFPIKNNRNEKIILHVARLVEKKGTSSLLKAFAIIQKKIPNVKLIILGDGPQRKMLEAYCNNAKIQKNVTFLGVQPPEMVIAMMQKSAVFCLPSIKAKSGDSEGLGMVFLEAAACGIPVVATYHGGIPEAVQDGETGLLVTENNPNQLAERLIFLLENESICEAMGKKGRALVETNFNLRKQTRKLEKIYNKLIL